MSVSESLDGPFAHSNLTYDFPVKVGGQYVGHKLIYSGEPVFVVGLNGENFGEGRFLGCEPCASLIEEDEKDFMPVLEVQGEKFRGYECWWMLSSEAEAEDIRKLPISDVKEYLAVMALEDAMQEEADREAQVAMGINFDAD